jgi:arylsulfatase A-like enzyme
VFDLFDNRLLAHLVRNGGLHIDAGSAGFARYVDPGTEKTGWQLARRRAGAAAALLRRSGRLWVPLSPEQAAAGGSITIALHSPIVTSLRLTLGHMPAQEAPLMPGWQLVSFEAPPSALAAGENWVDLAGPSQPLTIAWIRVGGTPDATTRLGPPARISFVDLATGELLLAAGDELVYYFYVPERTSLAATVAAVDPACRVVVRARTEGAAVDGQLAPGAAARVDLEPLAGLVARVSLSLAGCPAARLQHAALVAPGDPPVRPDGPPPRHVIVWVMDTLRADRVRPIVADARPEVPALARLAAGGAVFRQAYVQGNESQTSHASLWTSVYPARHNVRTAGIGGTWKLRPGLASLGGLARRAGLRARAVTANGMITADGGYARGFTSFVNMMREADPKRRNGWVPGERILERALAAVGDGWQDGRVLLFLGTIDTHKPWVGHEPWLTRYDPEPYAGVFEVAAWPADLGIKPGTMTCNKVPAPRDLQRIQALYDSAVSYQDSVLGQLLDELDRRGVADETMIIVTADHGEELWEAGRCGHGASLRETLVHVPLLLRYPPLVPAGVVIDEGVDVLDVLPTLADALGQPAPSPGQGQSLIPLAHGVGRGYPRPSYASQYEYAHAMRVGTWKIWRGNNASLRLYDLATDPHELAAVPSTERPIERRYMTDVFRLFLAHRQRWSKASWGVVTNMSPQAAAALDRHIEKGAR